MLFSKNLFVSLPPELPAGFKSYDVNKDGAITLSELSGITETNEDDASQPFHTADVDGKYCQ